MLIKILRKHVEERDRYEWRIKINGKDVGEKENFEFFHMSCKKRSVFKEEEVEGKMKI